MADLSFPNARRATGRVRPGWLRLGAAEPISATDTNGASRRRRRKLGPGPTVPYGAAIGPARLLLLWSLGSSTGTIVDRIL